MTKAPIECRVLFHLDCDSRLLATVKLRSEKILNLPAWAHKKHRYVNVFLHSNHWYFVTVSPSMQKKFISHRTMYFPCIIRVEILTCYVLRFPPTPP